MNIARSPPILRRPPNSRRRASGRVPRDRGSRRRPGYIEALHIVARTDLVAFVPSRLIAALAGSLSLITVKPPFDPGIDEQFMFYPTRAQFDPGSVWLRKLMLETGRELGRSKGRAA